MSRHNNTIQDPSRLLSSFCYLISPLRSQGGDGGAKPYYCLLCTNTSRAGMPSTQVNAMTDFPKHSGKLQDTIQRHPGGCHASVFPVIKWVVGRTGSTVRCFHDARHVVRLSNCCYRFVSLLLRHHRLTFSEAGGSLLTAGTLPCPLFPHPRAPPLDHVTQSHEPCPGPSVPAQASPCPRAVPPSLTPSVFMSVRASHV